MKKRFQNYLSSKWNSKAKNQFKADNIEEVNVDDLDYWITTECPKTYEAFKDEQFEELKLWCQKHRTYGKHNIDQYSEDKTEILNRLHVRMSDKLFRMKQIISSDAPENDESLIDTLRDLSNYSNIAILVNTGRWKD